MLLYLFSSCFNCVNRSIKKKLQFYSKLSKLSLCLCHELTCFSVYSRVILHGESLKPS